MKPSNFLSLVTITLLLIPNTALVQEERLEFSGFGRLIAGQLDTKLAEFQGFSHTIDFKPASLIALRADYVLSNNLSITAQTKAMDGLRGDDTLDWLYVNVELPKRFSAKLGKIRTPFSSLSQLTDVGFAFPWINLPIQVYSPFLLPSIEGIDLNYGYTGKGFDLNLETYIGEGKSHIDVAGISAAYHVKDVAGIAARLKIANWEFRSAHYQTDVRFDAEIFSILSSRLSDLGFQASARSVNGKGAATSSQASFIYENLDYFVRGEWMQLQSEVGLAPDVSGFYLTAGLNLYPYVLHLTFADSSFSTPKRESEIAYGVSTQQDSLRAIYDSVFAMVERHDLHSWTIGLRRDLSTTVALKAEASYLVGEADQTSFFLISDPNRFDRKAMLYSVALEWVF